jgi:hypothetical protein
MALIAAAIAGASLCASMSSSIAAALMDDEDPKKPTGSKDTIKLPKGRYVRLTFDDVTGKSLKWVLIVSELKVYGKDGTTNLALNKPTEVSGLHSAQLPAAAGVDGNVDTFFHSLTATDVDFFEVDLGEEVEISKIEVFNAGTDNRMAAGGPGGPGDKGAHIEIKDADKTVVKKTDPIKKIANKYTYDFNVKTPKWA